MSEFHLIDRYFRNCGAKRADVPVGIGDDGAVTRVPAEHDLISVVDTLVEGIHFFTNVDPFDLGHKALAVNLSDLAAMGAEPAWATLALTLPQANPDWLAAFSQGFCSLAASAHVALIGGDTTHGPLSVTVQVHGFTPASKAILRSGARVGDHIFVTGVLGDAGYALGCLLGELDSELPDDIASALHRPQPRIEAGQSLRGIANAAIDISDGLIADLGHILDRSGGLGARIDTGSLPLSATVAAHVDQTNDWRLPLTAGDDYELCFTVADHRLTTLATLDFSHHHIGRVEAEPGLRLVTAEGDKLDFEDVGYDHFNSQQESVS